MAGLIAGAGGNAEEGLRRTAWLGVDGSLIPSKSVGVEGTGSGSDIDRRLRLQLESFTTQTNKDKNRRETAEGLDKELSRVRHATSINEWLNDRQRRSTALIQGLVAFSHLEIDSLEQSDRNFQTRDRDGDGGSRSRNVHIKGNIARLFAIDIRFDVIEEDTHPSSGLGSGGGRSPEIRNLQLKLPSWLESTLNSQHSLYTRLLKRNDLPSILLMLRTMIPLLSLRRNLYTSLMETYTDLVRDHVRAWERENGVDFAPWHPPSSTSSSSSGLALGSSKRSTQSSGVDEKLARSLIISSAETLTLTNRKGSSLTLTFTIVWNRFGHASPEINAVPTVPSEFKHATSTAFLQTFEQEFQHLLKVAVAQDGIVGLPDHDDEHDDEPDPVVGRFGVMPAIHATIKAFFGLDAAESSEEESASEGGSE